MSGRPLPPPATYTLAQVAARFGFSVKRWTEMRDELEARGFPRPIVETTFLRKGGTLVRRGLWSRRQVDDWLDGRGPAEAAVIGLRRSLAGGDPELAERARRLAAGMG